MPAPPLLSCTGWTQCPRGGPCTRAPAVQAIRVTCTGPHARFAAKARLPPPPSAPVKNSVQISARSPGLPTPAHPIPLCLLPLPYGQLQTLPRQLTLSKGPMPPPSPPAPAKPRPACYENPIKLTSPGPAAHLLHRPQAPCLLCHLLLQLLRSAQLARQLQRAEHVAHDDGDLRSHAGTASVG